MKDLIACIVVGFTVAAVIAVIVVFSVNFSAERKLADDCYSRGGIPVQGDVVGGQSVTCIDPPAVLK